MAGTATGGVMTKSDMEAEIERRVQAELKRLEKEAAGYVITTPIYGTVVAEQDGTFNIQVHPGPYENPETHEVVSFEPHAIPCFNGRAYVRDANVAQWISDYYGYKKERATGRDALVTAMALEQGGKALEQKSRVL